MLIHTETATYLNYSSMPWIQYNKIWATVCFINFYDSLRFSTVFVFNFICANRQSTFINPTVPLLNMPIHEFLLGIKTDFSQMLSMSVSCTILNLSDIFIQNFRECVPLFDFCLLYFSKFVFLSLFLLFICISFSFSHCFSISIDTSFAEAVTHFCSFFFFWVRTRFHLNQFMKFSDSYWAIQIE